MSEWCQNRFEITGKSVCLDVLTQWIEGCETPRYPPCHTAEYTAVSGRLCRAGETHPDDAVSAISGAGSSRYRVVISG
ncbi:Uncharacterised protein [Escherichia coli]|uniref:DUF1281 domain-containing protein n=1 Tax=Escherichia coli TaxID=562 RepID=A0A376KNR1_ECOLX|nr:Uncharacterised protein [Escherichia coli]